MTDRPLYIWHIDGSPDLTPVRAAKAQLALDFKVKPEIVWDFSDVPSFEDRVLAIGSRPTFLCDYALTSERTSPEGWERALRWVLRIEEDDPKATTMLDILTSAFGAGVREIPIEEQDAMKRLRDYQQNRV